jgi:Zn-dependent protease with chaperone function
MCAVVYLGGRLSWLLELRAMRCEESLADAEMVRLTRDADACAGALRPLGAGYGLPGRWALAQKAMIATHPGADERVAALPGYVPQRTVRPTRTP